MVVDMQRFLIERQRDRLDRLDDYAEELITTGRANLSNQSRTNSAVLSLIAAASLENLIEVTNIDLAVQLDLDVAVLCFEQEAEPATSLAALPVAWLERGAVDALINQNKDTTLHADVLGKPEIFGEMASLVRSQALARLRPIGGAPAGLLALGSRRPDTFHLEQGTENISFLARVLELCLRRWLRG